MNASANVMMQDPSGGAAGSWNATDNQELPSVVVQVLLCTFLIISMQLGFAMLEVGSVRQEHRMTVLTKNVLDSVVSCLAFAISCQIQHPDIILGSRGVEENYLKLFHWSFLATSVTICSGSMAERTHMMAYLCYATIMSGVIYPVVANSAWGTGSGLLYSEFHSVHNTGYTYHDYAGSGVVHLTGGVAALVGNVMLGRRIMRPKKSDFLLPEMEDVPTPERQYSSQKEPSEPDVELGRSTVEGDPPEGRHLGDEDERLMEAVSMTWQRRFDCLEDDEGEFQANSYLQVLGMFNLWVGWYGFNAGSAFAKGGDHSVEMAGIVTWNTTVAASAGALGAYINLYALHGQIDVGFLCNGVLSGLVAITAACDVATPLAAGLIGMAAGLIVYPLGNSLLRRFRLDDPVDAIPVHAGCGLFGLLSVAFCKPSCDQAWVHHPSGFCEASHLVGWQFLIQAWGAFTIIWWTFSISLLVWVGFIVSEGIRLQEVEHLVTAYKQGSASKSGSLESCPEAVQVWQCIASHSRTARGIMQQFGWDGKKLSFMTDAATEDFQNDILDAIQAKVQTALEFQAVPTRAALCLSRLIARLRPFRELALVRLRISPFAELSGLGAAAADGGQVLQAMRGVMNVVSELRRDQSASVPLQMEVDQLSRHVQSQGIILQRLARSGRLGAGIASWSRRRLSSVPETQERVPKPQAGHSVQEASVAESCSQRFANPPGTGTPPTMPMAKSSTERGRDLHRDVQMAAGTNARSSTPEDRPRPARPNLQLGLLQPLPLSEAGRRAQSGTASASTLSDRSMGLLSERSGDDTPPPTIYGRNLRTWEGENDGGQTPEANAFATQLVNLLQAQQSLMSALQQAQSTGATPQLPTQPVNSLNQFNQELMEALERQANLGSRPSSSRSSRGSRTSRRSSRTSFELRSNFGGQLPSTPGSTHTDSTAVGMV